MNIVFRIISTSSHSVNKAKLYLYILVRHILLQSYLERLNERRLIKSLIKRMKKRGEVSHVLSQQIFCQKQPLISQ